MNQEEKKCIKHPEAGTHFGEATKVMRCDYCNGEIKNKEEKKK